VIIPLINKIAKPRTHLLYVNMQQALSIADKLMFSTLSKNE